MQDMQCATTSSKHRGCNMLTMRKSAELNTLFITEDDHSKHKGQVNNNSCAVCNTVHLSMM